MVVTSLATITVSFLNSLQLFTCTTLPLPGLPGMFNFTLTPIVMHSTSKGPSQASDNFPERPGVLKILV